MLLVRRLVLVCLEINICFKAKHIAGVHNILADAHSRLKLQTFKQQAPAYMNPHPTEIPRHLRHLLSAAFLPATVFHSHISACLEALL